MTLAWGQVVGLALEIWGVFLMAYGYFRVASLGSVPGVLVSALLHGNRARGLAELSAVTQSDAEARRKDAEKRGLAYLRGLALVALGFFVQVASVLLTLFG